MSETLYTQIFPWQISAPSAWKEFTDPLNKKYDRKLGSSNDIFVACHDVCSDILCMEKKIRDKLCGFSRTIIFFPAVILYEHTVWTMIFLRTEFQPDWCSLFEIQLDGLELPFDCVFWVDIVDNNMFCFLVIHPYVRIFCIRGAGGTKDYDIP